jgi:hypothetical protein
MAAPKSMTAREFFDVDDLSQQLRAAAAMDPWQIPVHLVHELCERAAEALSKE